MESGSLENTKRLEQLFIKHHNWLIGAAIRITKNEDLSKDLVGDLYEYLGSRVNPKIWYEDSFNILYCITYIRSRFYNKAKRDARIKSRDTSELREEWESRIDSEYDTDSDERFETAWDEVIGTINETKKTGDWASAELFKLYWIDNPDMTLAELAKKIGISNSTAFIHIKKMKGILKGNCSNPFQKK